MELREIWYVKYRNNMNMEKKKKIRKEKGK
jgi:hypothetical protein